MRTCAPHVLSCMPPSSLCPFAHPRTPAPACLPAPQIGQLISDAMQRVGRAGVVTMEVGSGMVVLQRLCGCAPNAACRWFGRS